MSEIKIVLVARHMHNGLVNTIANLMRANGAVVFEFLYWPEHEIKDVIKYIIDHEANVVIAEHDLCTLRGERLVSCLTNLQHRLDDVRFKQLLVANIDDLDVNTLGALPFGVIKD